MLARVTAGACNSQTGGGGKGQEEAEMEKLEREGIEQQEGSHKPRPKPSAQVAWPETGMRACEQALS